MANRFIQNPILTTRDIEPSQAGFVVACVLNPGVFMFGGKTWLLFRIAERPIQKEGFISLPILRGDGSMEILEFSKTDPKLDLSDARMVSYEGKTYLSTLSHLRLVCSDDGIHFHEPTNIHTKIFGEGALETFGIEDCRVSFMDGVYNLTYTQVSESGVGVGLMQTIAPYELTGFFGNVVFTNGHIINGDEIILYYGASDEVICGATFSIKHILDDFLIHELTNFTN